MMGQGRVFTLQLCPAVQALYTVNSNKLSNEWSDYIFFISTRNVTPNVSQKQFRGPVQMESAGKNHKIKTQSLSVAPLSATRAQKTVRKYICGR